MKKTIIALIGLIALAGISLQLKTLDLEQSQEPFNFNLDEVLKNFQENRSQSHILMTQLMGARTNDEHQAISNSLKQVEAKRIVLEKQLALLKLYASLHNDVEKLKRIAEFEKNALQQTYE